MIKKICLGLIRCVVVSSVLPFLAFGEGPKSITIRNIVGRGASRQLALTDAFRNAISQALGTYVVTSRTWDGETLDKKIFDNSDAVVKTHKIVDEGETRGKWAVTIDAEIVRNEMMKYIRREVTTKVGEGELANLLAKRQAINNAVQSLNLLFQNWRENVYRAEKYGNITIASDDNAESDTVRLSVPFIITFRWDAYGVFLSKVRNVLSQIAIDKTRGEYDKKQGDDFLKTNYSFYNRVGLIGKDGNEYIKKTGNPNGYGEIRIVSRLADDKFRYELYIVPNQVKHALDELLTRDAEIRFVFTSKGGENIASQAFSGEVYSFGWDWLCNDEISLGWSKHDEMQLITIMDAIKTEFSDRLWSNQRFYHASMPVHLEAASRISGCIITMCRPGEKDNCLSSRNFTTELMSAEEWVKIDQKPAQSISAMRGISNIPVKTTIKPHKEAQGVSVREMPEVRGEPNYDRVVSSISGKDKNLKVRILDFCRMTPDSHSARMWLDLSTEIESFELRQAAFKASGAALLCDKKSSEYKAKIRKRIKDVAAFEESFYAVCPECGGKKMTERKCSACAGSRVCKFSNCKGGMRLIRGFRGLGGDHYEQCGKCSGSGVCQCCNGSGSECVKCYRCKEKGIVFSADAVSRSYHNLVEQIANAFK